MSTTNQNQDNPEIQAQSQGIKLSPEQLAEKQTTATTKQQQNKKQKVQSTQTQPQKEENTITLDSTDQQYQEQVLAGQQQSQKPQDIVSPPPTTPQGDVQEGTVDPNTDSVAKDSQGNVNVSRGIIGLNSGLTEGTVADNVNPPSKFPNEEGRINPLTEEDLEKRIELERSKAGMDMERQRQIAIKIRTEIQGEEYKPPDEFKDDPELGPTPQTFQEKEPVADQGQGEQILNLDQPELTSNDQQENIKG